MGVILAFFCTLVGWSMGVGGVLMYCLLCVLTLLTTPESNRYGFRLLANMSHPQIQLQKAVLHISGPHWASF